MLKVRSITVAIASLAYLLGGVATVTPDRLQSAQAQTGSFAISVDPRQYVGNYFIQDVNGRTIGGSRTGRVEVVLPAGTYRFDTTSLAAASLGFGNRFSYFTFTVSSTGSIGAISLPEAAHVEGNTIVLHVELRSFDPGVYTGSYKISADPMAPRKGPSTAYCILGLLHSVDNFSAVGSLFASDSYLYFAARPAKGFYGASNRAAATVSFDNNTMQLRTVLVTVDPDRYVGTYRVSGQSWSRGVQSFALIAGLLVSLDNGASAAGSTLTFLPRADGGVWSTSEAAEGLSKALRLNTIEVEISAPAGVTYTLSGVGTFSGTAKVRLIPSLVTSITVEQTKGTFRPGYGRNIPYEVRVGSYSFYVNPRWE